MSLTMSIVVCTHNRCGLLRELLLSLHDQSVAGDSYEIIVVDNNSTDATRLVVEELSTRKGPLVRYVQERKQGLSCARNKGAFTSQGEIIAYLDDDSIASRHWAEKTVQVYRDNPQAACVGGKIEVRWPAGRPDWLPQSLERNYGESS